MLSVGDLLKVLEMVGYGAMNTDTVMGDGDIVSITYPLEITVPAGQTLNFSLPLQRNWICILDWCDIDLDGVGLVEVSYTRDGIQVWKFSRPIKTVPIDLYAMDSVVLTIKNNDTVNDHKVSILWHYCVARMDKYLSFVTAIGGFVNKVIEEVALNGMPKVSYKD